MLTRSVIPSSKAKVNQVNEVVFGDNPNIDPYTWAYNLAKCTTKEQATAKAKQMTSSASEVIASQESLVLSLIERNWLKLDWAKVR